MTLSAGLLLAGVLSCGAPPEADLLANPGAGADETGPAGSGAGDQLIVAAVPGADPADLRALFEETQVSELGRIERLSAWLVGLEPERREEARALLTGSPLVEQVIENRIYSVEGTADDPLFAQQWHLAVIEAPAAWDVTAGSTQIPIAVLDTGVDASHPDLKGRVLPGTNVWQNSADTHDQHGHGTMVAGVIAAAGNNAEGITPVTWLNPVVPVRVSSETGQSSSWMLASGIQWAATAGLKVINISFAPLQDDPIVLRQCQSARLSGALVVISSGNTGQEAGGQGSTAALFTGATDASDSRASFSTYGGFVDISAPGVSILTTKVNGLYGTASGTSFAAPMVSGTAALVWSVNPGFRPATVREILVSTAVDLGAPGRDSSYGHGRVNAAAAVESARSVVEQADLQAPTVSIRSPLDQATLSAPVAVNVTAADNDELADVTLYVDGQPIASDFAVPYQFLLNPNRFAPGTHKIKAVASDVAGNAAAHEILLQFQGPPDLTRPTVRMISPPNGSAVAGVITVRADVVDDRSVSKADVLVDGKSIGSVPFQDAGVKVAFNWNTSTALAGDHVLAVRATDSSGNMSMASVQVTVNPR